MSRSRIMRTLAIVGLAAAIGLSVSTHSAPSRPAPAATVTNERCGIDQLRIRRTAQGHLLDLRYRVVDPQRAASLLAKHATAYVVHARSGKRLAVPNTPKAGALRTTGVPRAGRSYFALFANPAGLVRSGDRVSVVLGELTTELTVE